MNMRHLFPLLALLALGTPAAAGDLQVRHAYARATMPQQSAGGAWLTIENGGSNADRLVGAASPAAKRVELHTMSMENNVMRMREVPAIEVKAGSKLEMKPGTGYHLMLIGLQQPLKAGARIPVTLQFEQAGRVEVELTVQGSAAAGHGHGQAHGHGKGH